MYAVIATGGKQCPVEPGKKYWIEKIDQEVGSEVVFDEVMACRAGDAFLIGQPTVSSVKVIAEVVEHGRADKIEIIKFRRRKHSMTRAGHRQAQTCVLIKDIQGVDAPKKDAVKSAKAITAEPKAKAETKKTAAPKKTATKKTETAAKPAKKTAGSQAKKATATKTKTQTKQDK
jgi:large subunit ribosomal protein L21